MVGVAHLEITVTDLAGTMSPSTSVSHKSHCTEFRLPLISVRGTATATAPPSLPVDDNDNVLDWTPPAASITFSPDTSQLACLIPHCHQCCPQSSIDNDDDMNMDQAFQNPLLGSIASTLVIFGLDHEVSEEDDNRNQKFDHLPLPSFLQPVHDTQSTDSTKIRVLPEPCDPRIVRGIQSKFLLPFDSSKRSQRAIDDTCTTSVRDSTFITSLCNCGGSALLAGCGDGSIIAIHWKRARVAGLLHHAPLSMARGHAVLSLCHTKRDSITPHAYYSSDTKDDEDGVEGRLAAVRADGSITLYRTSSVPAESEKGDEHDTMSFDKISEDEEIILLDSSYMSTADIGSPPSSPMFARQSNPTSCDTSSPIRQGPPPPGATKAHSSKRRHDIFMRLDASFTIGGRISSHADDHDDSTLGNTGNMNGTSNGFHHRLRRRSSHHAFCYLDATWIDYYTLAATVDMVSLPTTLRKSNHENPVCHVWAFCNATSDATASCRHERTLKKLISVLSLHPNRLAEDEHNLFGKSNRASDCNNLHPQPRGGRVRPHSSVAFDPFSGCLLVTNTMMASCKSTSDSR
jgi:hypothetical protein